MTRPINDDDKARMALEKAAEDRLFQCGIFDPACPGMVQFPEDIAEEERDYLIKTCYLRKVRDNLYVFPKAAYSL